MKQTRRISRLFFTLLVWISCLTILIGCTAPAVLAAEPKRDQAQVELAREALVRGLDEQKAEIPVPKSSELVSTSLTKVIEENPRFLTYVRPVLKEVRTEADGTVVAIPHYDTHLKPYLNRFLAGAPKHGSDYDKELYVHDKLADLITYQKGQHTLDDALIRHRADCQAYSRMMMVCLDFLGVRCREISGDAGGSHRWNVVTLNGKNYMTDATWDDLDDGDPATHRYFNLSKDQMAESRDPYDPYRDAWNTCRYTDQNYYARSGLLCSSLGEAVKAMQTSREIQVTSDLNPILILEALRYAYPLSAFYLQTKQNVIMRR